MKIVCDDYDHNNANANNANNANNVNNNDNNNDNDTISTITTSTSTPTTSRIYHTIATHQFEYHVYSLIDFNNQITTTRLPPPIASKHEIKKVLMHIHCSWDHYSTKQIPIPIMPAHRIPSFAQRMDLRKNNIASWSFSNNKKSDKSYYQQQPNEQDFNYSRNEKPCILFVVS